MSDETQNSEVKQPVQAESGHQEGAVDLTAFRKAKEEATRKMVGQEGEHAFGAAADAAERDMEQGHRTAAAQTIQEATAAHNQATEEEDDDNPLAA